MTAVNSIWEEKYKEALEGLPENSWVAHAHHHNYQEIEISVVHTSDPHGLISYGWDSYDSKIILLDADGEFDELPKRKRKKIFDKFMRLAQGVAIMMNMEDSKP